MPFELKPVNICQIDDYVLSAIFSLV